MAAPLISYRSLAWVLGGFLVVLAASMLVPIAYSLATDQADLRGLLESSGLTGLAGAGLLWAGHRRPRADLRRREALLLVVLVWAAVCGLGALPFYLSSLFSSYTDAVFEATSGFTTTGATVLAQVEALSRPLHLWRSFSHWLGGMGIVLLGIAILPLVGQGGSGMYRAEFSGAAAERLRPRVVETARALWKIYLILTVAELLCLILAGLSPFEALCHSFSTLGTGGFSTRTDSIGAFGPQVQYIVILFMLLGGISFVQHFRLWVERDARAVLGDYELRAYVTVVGVATLLVIATLLPRPAMNIPETWEPTFRTALFQVVSILTTTGFVTADYGQWQPAAQLILLVLMFIGGSTGSTAGGIKVARMVVVRRIILRHFRQLTEPQGVFRIHIKGTLIPELTVCGVLNLVFLALLTLLAASLAIAATGVDLVTTVSAVAACLFNVGPGLGGVGPTESYAGLSAPAKWVLSFCMIAGRLELYTVMVLLTSGFWRR
jgi:trk system potassium uptake protein TrkH